jgi:DNA-binding LacI/PurR family transcriptional regulator
MEQSPSLASMARDLGLSVATVSNVYNYPDKVSQKLRERVLAHAEVVKYPGPNPLARQLSIGYTKTIGLIFKEELPHVFRHEAAVGFIDGLAEACSRGGYNLLLIPSNPMIIDRPMASIATAAVDGCIAFSMGDNDADLVAAIGRRQPVVIVDQPAPLDGVGWVGLDDRVAVRDIVRELVSLGHTKFGALTMRIGNVDHGGLLKEEDLDTSRYSVPRERMAGLRQALEEAGLPQLVPTVESFTISRAAGSIALRRLLDADPSISAVVSFDDELALGAIDEARQRGLRVPEDISITGFDDIPSAAVHGLTTVRQPLLQKGLRAGQMLLQRIADQRQTQSLVSAPAEVLSTNIVRRTSSGPAPR